MSLDKETRKLIAALVAAAPPLTNEQITDLRRILRPNDLSRRVTVQPVTRVAETTTHRRAA